MKSSLWWVCVASCSWLGCAAVRPAEEAAPIAPGSLAPSGSLAAPVQIAAGRVSDSRVDFTIAGGFDSARPVALTIAQPTLKLHTTTDGAELDALALPLGDIDVPAAALPPTGLQLRDLTLTADPTRAEVVHAADDALELRATVPLTLHWSLVLADGSLYPLGPVPTAPLVLDVQIARSQGQAATATVQASCAGTCWAVDGVARLSDG
jgi:hypothetical protein